MTPGERQRDLIALQDEFVRRCGPEALEGALDPDFDARMPAQKKFALYRGGLRQKRLGEVRVLLPATRARLGEPFDRAFLAFCERCEPLGFARHRDDAIAFAATLKHPVARVERAYLLAARNVAGAWFAIGTRGLVVLVRLRRGARLRRFALTFSMRPQPAP